VPGELPRRDGTGVGERMARSDEELVRLVDHANSADRIRQVLLRGNRVESGVDRPGFDSGDCVVDVGVQRHDIQFDLRMHAVEVLDKPRCHDPPVDDIDAQSAPTGADGRISPLCHPEKFTGVGQECLAVDGEPGAAGGAGEQPHLQIFLQRGDALGDGLLSDRQADGGFLELARFRNGDEGADGFEIHAGPP
jgi:hypothetical protein